MGESKLFETTLLTEILYITDAPELILFNRKDAKYILSV